MRSNGRRKEIIYLVGVLVFALMILGSAGAWAVGNITFPESAWQIVVSMTAGLWLCYLIQLEETRAAHRRAR